MLRSEFRLWPFTTFLGILDLKSGVILALMFAVFNKVAGVYGLIAVLTGAGGSFAQLSMYIYSVLGLVAIGWGLQVVKAEDARKTLYLAHLFSADYVLSTSWTAYFAVTWWWHTAHDGARQANSAAQEDLIKVAHIADSTLTPEQRAAAALLIWNREKGMAFAVIFVSWLSKIYLALLIYSFALHLRKGSYRALARTQPTRAVGTTSAAALPEDEDEDEDIGDFYRVPLRSPVTPNRQTGNHLNKNVVDFAQSVQHANGDLESQNRARPSPPRNSTAAPSSYSVKKAPPPPDADEDEVLFDDEYPYVSSGSTSNAHSKRGTESSTSRSASSDNERDSAARRNRS
ncbi:Inositolphosphorylceramide synthase subunit Kei1-domain-containing protein [Mycena polygramma]|nr:Inositolphosphorylceramide synthase subunit Kei1-domain-containing protein [Mycena polygramma]